MPRLDDSVVGSYVSGAISGEIRPAQAVPPAQPVAEGFFGRKKGKNGAGGEEPGVGAPLGYRSSSTQPVLQAEDADSGETDGAASVARGPAKAAQRSLLPSRRPKDAKVTKYDTPKATSVRPVLPCYKPLPLCEPAMCSCGVSTLRRRVQALILGVGAPARVNVAWCLCRVAAARARAARTGHTAASSCSRCPSPRCSRSPPWRGSS